MFVWGLGGLVANPNFTTGDHATAVRWLFVDFNGWHAGLTMVFGAAALAAAAIPRWALLFLAYSAVQNGLTGLWAAIDHRPVWGLFYLPTSSDTVLHLTLAAVSAAGVIAQVRSDRLAAHVTAA
jgi:hypothetical protein